MSGGLGDFSLFDLFKAEAEQHCAVLNEGLLTIEANPDDVSHLEPLMRAAHSIKGAARIIGLDTVVELAHAMEDCFVAAQKGEERLVPARVDQLLAGVDALERIGARSEGDVAAWLEEHADELRGLTTAVREPVPADAGAAPPTPGDGPDEPAEPVESGSPPGPAPARGPTPESAVEPAPEPAPAAPKAEAKQDDSTVLVSAASLDRMMQLASETMIASRRFQSLRRTVDHLREMHRQLTATIGHEVVRQDGAGEAAVDPDESARIETGAVQLLQEHAVDLEQAAWRSERLSTELYNEVLGSRMRPFIEGTRGFPRTVRDIARTLGKQVTFEIEGGTVPVDRDILRKLEAPLNHIVRNCVDHGIETPAERAERGKPERGRITMEARHHAGMLTVQVRDDGGGIDPERIRRRIVERGLADRSLADGLSDPELLEFLLLPGFSTASEVTEVSGRGVGLDVAHSMVQEVAGTLQVESEPEAWTLFTFRLPVTLSVIRAALVEISGEPYAFPLSRFVRLVRLDRDEITPVEGRRQFVLEDESVGLVRAADVLELGGLATFPETISALVIGQRGKLCGLTVDRFVGEQDLVVRTLDPRLGRVPHLSAAAVLEDGTPALIVDVEDLYQSVQQLLGEGRLRGVRQMAAEIETTSKRRVLVVDDSITVREVQRQLLARHGYEVDVAVDGRDGWKVLSSGHYDLLITDVDMPRMNGIELIRTVRREPKFENLPIVIVSYKDREEDRLLGMEAGANVYLTKGSFHDDSLVRTVGELIGEAT